MSQPSTDRTAIRLVLDTIRSRGWNHPQGLALEIVNEIFERPSSLADATVIEALVPADFLLVNHTTASAVAEALMARKADLERLIASHNPSMLPAVIQLDDIDSFSKAGDIDPASVAQWADPFNVSEDYIKRMIAEIVGEPYIQKDWGGELDDLYTGQARLGGRTVTASCLLKGPGLRGPMTQKNLGKNGDQIDRLLLQPAELFVVQHVNKIQASVRRELANGILAKRFHGVAAVGTVWDGADTARLAAGYGYLDVSTGQMRNLS